MTGCPGLLHAAAVGRAGLTDAGVLLATCARGRVVHLVRCPDRRRATTRTGMLRGPGKALECGSTAKRWRVLDNTRAGSTADAPLCRRCARRLGPGVEARAQAATTPAERAAMHAAALRAAERLPEPARTEVRLDVRAAAIGDGTAFGILRGALPWPADVDFPGRDEAGWPADTYSWMRPSLRPKITTGQRIRGKYEPGELLEVVEARR